MKRAIVKASYVPTLVRPAGQGLPGRDAVLGAEPAVWRPADLLRQGRHRDVEGEERRPTATHEQQLQIASELFVAQRAALKALVETDVPAIEKEMERVGAPYTPGRVPGAR